MNRSPRCFRLSDEAYEYLGALAAYNSRTRANQLERLLMKIPPPGELSTGAHAARAAHQALLQAHNASEATHPA
jgi:hypothetical protein